MFTFEAINAVPSVPNDSPSPISEQSSPTDDGSFQHFDDGDDALDLGASQPKRKSRRPPSTAERRATHNAVERARRESLNGRFLDLAGALPNMANVKRPSKSVIVAKSLEFVQSASAREQSLISQNDALRQELNELRARLGMTPVSASSSPVTSQLPLTAGRPREHSIVSSSDAASSLIGTPSSNSGSFVETNTTSSAVPISQPSGNNSPQAFQFPHLQGFGNVFADKMGSHPAPALNSPVGTSPPATFPGAGGLPVVDVNYLMALSLQHQQQQQHHQASLNNMMGMQGRGFPTAATAAPWGVPLGMPPVAAGGSDANWLFA